MSSSINNLLTRAVMQRFRQDEGKQFLQITGKAGEVRSDVEQICQYGFRSRPLSGSRGIMLAYGGNKDNSSVICVDDKRHGKDELEEGDVMLYNEKTGTRLILRDDKILGTSDEEISDTVNESFVKILDGTIETNVNGTKTVTTDGQIQSTIGSTTLTITDSSIVFAVGGKTYTFDGTEMNADADITSNGITLDAHVHSGVTTGASNTGNPV
jgi:phage baseplate assembly protein V